MQNKYSGESKIEWKEPNMAQVIAPENWQRGIKDPKMLPTKFTPQLFVGNGEVKIANNESACRVWDMQTTDAIFTYDDRRMNGLANVQGEDNFNQDGRDGWGASAWGPFQEVRFDSRVYTMGRHRSCAFRIFEEAQYNGKINQFGNDQFSSYSHGGQGLMKTAQIISEIKSEYEARVMGVDMDKYNIFAVCNGHISGRAVGVTQEYEDQVFDGNASHYTWVAQPGPVQGQSIPPRFAPIQCMTIDFDNLPLALSSLRNAWKTVGIDANDCVICIDPEYHYDCMKIFTGDGIPATANAYTDLQDGNFTKLMGYTFDFEIPTSYYPWLYVDANLNVVHSADGKAAYDKVINSIEGSLRDKLIASHRMGVNNFVRRIWDNEAKEYKMVVTNYPLGDIGAIDYYGNPIQVDIENYGKPETYPWAQPGAGYGLPPFDPDAPEGTTATGPVGEISLQRVVGLAIYKKAAQLSQEYSDMRTADGETRAKCTEMVMDVKYDAWVIEKLSAGIIPIIDIKRSDGKGIPVQNVNAVAIKNDTAVDEKGVETNVPLETKEVSQVATSKPKTTKNK